MMVAIAQLEASGPEKSMEKAEIMAETVKLNGADLIVFPEEFINITLPVEEAASRFKEFLSFSRSLAKRHDIDIVPGSLVERRGSVLHNTAFYISRSGRIKARYRKVNLWVAEEKSLSRGDRLSVFNTRHGKMGLCICRDLMFPEMIRRMSSKGARIVICPSYWAVSSPAGRGEIEAEMNALRSIVQARAVESNVIMVYANATGTNMLGGRRVMLAGSSGIAYPDAKGQRHLLREESLMTEDVRTESIMSGEKAFRIRNNLKLLPY